MELLLGFLAASGTRTIGISLALRGRSVQCLHTNPEFSPPDRAINRSSKTTRREVRLKFSTRFAVAVCAGVIGWTLACRRNSETQNSVGALRGDVVATIGKTALTKDVLQRELQRRGRVMLSSSEKLAVLEELIRFEVAYQRALAEAYDKRPEIHEAFKSLIVARYREDLQKAETSNPISEDEIAAHYQATLDQHTAPEQVNVAIIFFPVPAKALPEKRAELQRRIEDVRAQAIVEARQLSSFGALAQQHSAHQASRYRGGELGWMTRDAAASLWEATLVDRIFQIQSAGEITPAIEGSDGFYLVKMMDRKPAAVRPLAEVREKVLFQVREKKRRQRETDLYARLKQGIEIQINHALLEQVESPDPAQLNQPSMPTR